MKRLSLELMESVTPERLHLILLPTEACNFRCVYCYEAFRLKRMDPAVVGGVKRLLDRRAPTLAHLTISWFGGEPLLAYDVVTDILRHVAALRSRSPALAFISDMTTNASLLTPGRLEELVALGTREFQVTFDGPRRFHDRKRVRPGGKATFDLVWGNLIACRDSEARFRIQVRLHVDRNNQAAVPEFLDEYQAAFGPDDRFELFIRGLSRLGGANDPALPILEGEERSRAIEGLRALARDRGLRIAAVPPVAPICYAARGNSFVVRADGRVNKCTVALDHPRNQVGSLQPDGTLRLRAEMVRPWMRGFESGGRAELSCPMHGLADVAENGAPAPTRRTDASFAVTGGVA